MKKTVDNKPAPDQDNPDCHNIVVRESVLALIEMTDQKIENRPLGEKGFTLWKKEVGYLIDFINNKLGFSYYDKRRLLGTNRL